jgi:hypothetical protein
MRGFGDYQVRQGLWKINPLRWMETYLPLRHNHLEHAGRRGERHVCEPR